MTIRHRTFNRACILIAVVALITAPGLLQANCESLPCPELWEWSQGACGCVCTSYECCQFYGPEYCTGQACCDIYGLGSYCCSPWHPWYPQAALPGAPGQAPVLTCSPEAEPFSPVAAGLRYVSASRWPKSRS
jgi:hypothetical protein